MSDRKNNQPKQLWKCPVCGNRAYQKYGGFYIPAVKYKDDKPVEEFMVKSGRHFICKGCSVHFSNPKLFNGERL